MFGLLCLYFCAFLVASDCEPNESENVADRILELETLVSRLVSKENIQEKNEKRIRLLENHVNILKTKLDESNEKINILSVKLKQSNRERKVLQESVKNFDIKIAKLTAVCSEHDVVNIKSMNKFSQQTVTQLMDITSNSSTVPYQEKSSVHKRLLETIHTSPSAESAVGFYAYMTTDEPNPGPHHTLIFDEAKTNVGGGYNRFSGIFTAPVAGVYVLTWTVVCDRSGYIYTEMTVNSNPVGGILTDADAVTDIHTVTGIVVVQLNAGDVTYVRTSPNGDRVNGILSHPAYRTSFSGWKLS